MNDPQDLLYTNKFIDTNILSDNEMNNQTRNYDRFIDYQMNQNTEDTNNTLRYINNDDEETDNLNTQKTLYQPFPIDNNKNNYPMFDPLLRDLSKNTYTKVRDIVISVDTENRNPIFYPFSSNIKINLPRTISNIHQIEISNINVPNFLKSIQNMKNNFSWQYFSDYYLNTDIAYNLIPFPGYYDDLKYYAFSDIKYSTFIIPDTIIDNDLTFDPSQFLTYQTNISEGNYTVDQLIHEIEKETLKVLHGNDNKNYLQENEENVDQLYEEPYYSFPHLRNSPHHWKFEFNKQTGGLYCVNRIEELEIYTIQTFHSDSSILTPNYFKKYDIFYNYSNLGPSYTLDPNYIYITVPLFQGTTDNWFDNSSESSNTNIYPDSNYNNPFSINPFPLVLSCDATEEQKKNQLYEFISQITMTCFWDLRIYTNGPFSRIVYTEDQLSNLSYYKISDIITIPKLNVNLVRFALRWTPISSKGLPFQNSFPKADYGYYKPVSNVTNIISKSLDDFLENNGLKNILHTTTPYRIRIGRSLPCRLIYGKFNNKYQSYKSEGINETKKSILEYFNFSIANSTNGDIKNVFNNGFAFIHSNIYGSTLDSKNPLGQFIDSLSFFSAKKIDLGLKIVNDSFYLKNNNFVFLKIFFDGVDLGKTRQNQNEIASSETQKHVNQNYTTSPLIQYLGIGESIDCYNNVFKIKNKEYEGIFCKIFTSTIPGDINILENNISSKIIFNAYDNLLNDISDIRIEILDSELREIETKENYNFDLKFIYSDSKLKETNINTKTNKIDLVGNNY